MITNFSWWDQNTSVICLSTLIFGYNFCKVFWVYELFKVKTLGSANIKI